MIIRTLDNPSQTYECELSFEQLVLNPENLVTVMGYPAGECPPHVFESIDQVLERAGELCRIRGGYRLVEDLERLEDKIHYRIGNVEFSLGKIISVQLRKASSAALFVCTIGAGLENWASELMRDGDYVTGFVADMIASETVELAMDQIQNELEKTLLAMGRHITNRYSPGYCGWHVSEQHKLFSLLPPEFCGISLRPSSLMTPIKSVSGIIGIGEQVRKVDYTCRFCDMKDCVYRRRKEKALAE
jgi:hypothetical protein